jgi:hypothetical protein
MGYWAKLTIPFVNHFKEFQGMNRILVIVAMAFAATLVACASTSLDGVWIDPEYAAEGMDNFMIVAIAENPGNRRLYETQMTQKLESKKVRALPSYTVVADGANISEEALQPVLKQNEVDAIVVTRVLSVDTSQDYVPGSTYVVPNSYYGGFYGYYSRSYAVVSEPGYYTENTTVLLETNVYDVANSKLIWSGVSRTYNPTNTSSAINEITSLIVDSMNKDGLLAEHKQ